MTTFKEISVEDYKKLLDNKQHTFAKTFKNIQLLQNFEKEEPKNNINDIINEEKNLEKENKYIEKLSDKLSEKISNSKNNNNDDIIENKKKYIFLNTHDYYSENPKDILKHIKKIYIKSNISYDNIYKPQAKTIKISLDTIIRKIEKDTRISNELKDYFIEAYNTIPNKTKIKFHNKFYQEYVMEPVEKHYNEKGIEADDEKSIIKIDDDNIPAPSTEDKSLKDKLTSNIGKAIIKTMGQGYNKIRIDNDLLKKNILKVRYISNNRKLNNKFLKDDYKISNNMKQAILKNKNLNKLTKNEYDVYNALQKYRNNDELQLYLSSYLAGNKSKDLYNKINELLYNNFKNNKITKKEYQDIINKL